MIRVTPASLPAARAFLERDPDRAMFPLANLADFGLDGDHPRAPSIWALGSADDPRGLLVVTREGMVYPVLPEGGAEAAAEVLSGKSLIGVIGPNDQVRAIEHAAGLRALARNLDHDEAHFAMALADLVQQPGPGRLIPAAEADRETVIAWRAAYESEAIGTPPSRARAVAEETVAHWIAVDSHRVLAEGATPLALTGFNAALPEIVQIGGVYTPPERRGLGLARRAVALHLAEARAAGVARATLFASGPAAEAAYRAVGFGRIGDWTLLFFDGPQGTHD